MYKKSNAGILLALVLSINGQQGCNSYNHSVVAATGTSIGVEISQNPATQVPQAKLGYQRAEMAIVPTNRSAEKTATENNSMGNGAKDHGEVIMELRYGGIFDTGKSSGIYQRLAVGSVAVAQPGAAFMFARNAEGDIDPSVSKAIMGVPKADPQIEREKAPLSKKFNELKTDPIANKALLDAFQEAAKAAGYSTFGDFAGDENVTADKIKSVRKQLEAKGVVF